MGVAPGLGRAANRQHRQVLVVGGELIGWLVVALEQRGVGVGTGRRRSRVRAGPGRFPWRPRSPVPMARAVAGGRAAGPASVESTVSARADRGSVRATTAALAARTRAWCSLRSAMSSGVSWNICHHPMPATTANAGHSMEYR